MRRTRMAVATGVLALVVVVFGPIPAIGWGQSGHSLVNRAAALNVADQLPEFWHAAVDRLEWLGYEPDRWRRESEPALRAAQAPEHFLDLEPLGPDFVFPPDRFGFYRALEALRAGASETEKESLFPERVGLQPYAVIEIFDRLKVSLRQFRQRLAAGLPTDLVERNAITWAGWLGHYVADAAQPLHTSIHYDGWRGAEARGFRRERGIHHHFETAFVDRNLGQLEVRDLLRPPRDLGDPFSAYLDFLRRSHTRLEPLYEMEARGGLADDSEQAVQFVRTQLAEGAQMLSDLWFTAWIASGRQE